MSGWLGSLVDTEQTAERRMTRSDSLLAQAAIAEELLEPHASPSQPLFEDDDIEDPRLQSHDEPAPVRRAGSWFCARLMSEWTSCFNLLDRELDRQDLKRARREGVRPRKRRYFPILTAFTTWLCVFVYIYMCAQWPAYRMDYCRNFPNNTWYCSSEEKAKLKAAAPTGPMAAFRTLVLASHEFGQFDGDFLVAWGARYTPIMRYEADQWWRWISSFYVHLNRGHIVGNLLIYVPVAGLLEWRFGPLRFVLVLVLTIVGGNMFSSLLEEECFFYAGASSGVYGVIGMQFGDALYNWHRTEAPLARILITLVMVAQMAYQIAALDQSVSGMAHLGSFLLGLCGGVTAMMTHIPPTGWQKAAGAVAVLGLATGVVALPMVVYGVGPLGQQAQFAADSFQCCYTAPEGWEPVCRTFPRAEHLRALPIKYDLPANTTWLVTGVTSSAASALSLR